MARARFFDVVQMVDSDGFVKKVASPEITVYEQGTTTPVSGTLYAADSGGSTLTNPFTAGPDGSVEFYMATAGRVSVKYDGTGAGFGTVTRNMEGVWPDPGSLNTTITSPNGDYTASMSNDGKFTAFGLLSRLHGWDLEIDGGLTPGTNPANATANSVKFQTLVDRIAAIGYGDIIVKQPFPLGPVDLSHGLGGNVPINIVGYPGRGEIRFAGDGASTPFLHVGASGSGTYRSGLYDLRIVHTDQVVGYPTIHIGPDAFYFEIIGGGIFNRGNGEAALIGVYSEGFHPKIHRSKIELRNDEATLTTGGLTPVGVWLGSSADIGGPEIYETDIDGCPNRSDALRFAHTGLIDTPRFSRCLWKDHKRGIVHSGSGTVANLIASELGLDKQDNNAIHFEPTTGGSVVVATFTNTWIDADDIAVLLSGANGGTVSGVSFLGGYWTDSETAAMKVTGHSTVSRTKVVGVEMLSLVNTPGDYAVDVGGASGPAKAFTMIGCTVQCRSGASGAARFSSAGTGMVVQGNTWVGVTASIGFSNDSANNASGNVFLSSL